MVGLGRWRRSPAPGHPKGRRVGWRATRGMRVGLYGGSFNPAHEGHAHVAETALRRLGLNRVIWLVAPRNPLKPIDEAVELSSRVAGARRRARGTSMIVSDIEARIGARFTLDTVRWLKARHPGVRFVWIMGADCLAGFHRWRGWVDLANELPIAVISRPGSSLRGRLSPMARRFSAAALPARAAASLPGRRAPAWVYLPAPYRQVSSTALRDSRLTAPSRHAKTQ